MKRRNVRQHNVLRQQQQREAVRPGRVATQALVRNDPADILMGMWEDLKQGFRKVFGDR